MQRDIDQNIAFRILSVRRANLPLFIKDFNKKNVGEKSITYRYGVHQFWRFWQ